MTEGNVQPHKLRGTVQAIQFLGTEESQDEIAVWCDCEVRYHSQDPTTILLGVDDNILRANTGDWIIRGPEGFYEVIPLRHFDRLFVPVGGPG